MIASYADPPQRQDVRAWTLASMSALAFFYFEEKRYAEAEPLMLETVGSLRGVLGEDHPDYLFSLNNLAGLCQTQGRHEESEPLFARAIDGARRSLPPGHIDLGRYLFSHGTCLVRLRRPADAEPELLEAYDILRATFGEGHARTRLAAGWLVTVYGRLNQPDKAEKWRSRTAE